MLIKLFTAAALSLLAPVAQAQTAPPGQAVPATEPPVKAVPQSGRQPKPHPVDNNGPLEVSAGPDRAVQGPGRRHADRAARRAHGLGHGPGHGLGGHGRRH
ncbi:hypothetical protein [Hymenobacter sp. UYCo722]|uniref:hypothetical protein n=1 Tax=Hymenobacter sp. UYCo722 TaxID=3156335 RepID=UPI003395B8EF